MSSENGNRIPGRAGPGGAGSTPAAASPPETIDVQVERHGLSLFTFRPLSDVGAAWLEGHTEGMWYGGALVVEPRYAFDLARGCMDDGLVVR